MIDTKWAVLRASGDHIKVNVSDFNPVIHAEIGEEVEEVVTSAAVPDEEPDEEEVEVPDEVEAPKTTVKQAVRRGRGGRQ